MCHEPFFSESTLLYFFSALLQANAAILSIVGVFLVFRLQSLRSAIDTLRTIFLQKPGESIWPERLAEFDEMDISKKRKWIAERQQKKELTIMLPLFKSWITHLENIESLKTRARRPTILLALSICLFTFGLSFAAYVHSLGFESEAVSLAMCSAFEVLIIVSVVATVLDLIKSG